MLVTTHYLDEAERCHRVALIHAGRLAALGTTTEVKRIFAGRPIVEVRAPQAGRRHARARRHAGRREDQPVRHLGPRRAPKRRRRRRTIAARRLAAAGLAVDERQPRSCRRSRTCSSTSSRRPERGARMRKALAVDRKELRQILRDRRTLLILVFVPAFFLLLYGYALNFDIRHVALAVEDRDGTPQSRAVVSAFVNSGYFDLVATRLCAAPRSSGCSNLNSARAVLVIPEGFGRDVARRPAGAGAGHHQRRQRQHRDDRAGLCRQHPAHASAASWRPAASCWPPPLAVEPRIWYNPELRSTLFLVPGLIAYIAMITAVASTALSIVREKEFGTMEQVRMAPIDTFSFIIGKTIPYFLISLASAALIILASMVLFGLPMRGNWLSLLVALSLFLVGALGTGS